MKNRINDNFTIVYNKVLNDNTISLKAKGLYAFLCSKPDGWKFSYSGLKKQLKEGEKSIRTAVRELVKIGALLRIPIKEKGKFIGRDWIINPTEEDIKTYTDPAKNGQNRNCLKPELPVLGSSENGKEISNKDISNKEINNKYIYIYREEKNFEKTKKQSKPLKEKKEEVKKQNSPGGSTKTQPVPEYFQKAGIEKIPRDWTETEHEFFKEKNWWKILKLRLEWLQVRKTIKAPNTETAKKLALNKLKKLSNGVPAVAEKIIEQSILGGRKSFYPLKDTKEDKQKTKTYVEKQIKQNEAYKHQGASQLGKMLADEKNISDYVNYNKDYNLPW